AIGTGGESARRCTPSGGGGPCYPGTITTRRARLLQPRKEKGAPVLNGEARRDLFQSHPTTHSCGPNSVTLEASTQGARPLAPARPGRSGPPSARLDVARMPPRAPWTNLLRLDRPDPRPATRGARSAGTSRRRARYRTLYRDRGWWPAPDLHRRGPCRIRTAEPVPSRRSNERSPP